MWRIAHTLALLALLPLALGAPLSRAAAVPVGAIDEVAVMRRLREALHEAGVAAIWHGWTHLNDSSHPCEWSGVACAANGSIAKLSVACRSSESALERSRRAAAAAGAAGPLLPELAQLPLLQEMEMSCLTLSAGSIPAALVIAASALGGQLPDIQPGAMPLLQHLLLHAPGLQSTLPPGWGAGADVLPSLRRLDLTFSVHGRLPGGWAAGFRSLEQLSIAYSPIWRADGVWMEGGSQGKGRWPEAAPSAEARTLPEGWAAPGSFPSLRTLRLGGLGMSGSLPASWVDGGWPALEEL
ncbi:hypothetical protein ABPG75_006482 [Micractinium tetrahymenae]